MQPALPPGSRAPMPVQTLGWWTRYAPYVEGLRARFGKRFTMNLIGQVPFVLLSDPDEVKELFTAPPEALHPGEGARILLPVVGRNSVILLDERAHLEQRKLMLPAFHGEQMARLADLMTEVAEREVAGWPRAKPIAVHGRLQALTLEIILRAVFGLDPGPRMDALRDRLTNILELGSGPAAMIPFLQRSFAGRGPWPHFERLRDEADEQLFQLIDERRGENGERDDILAMLLAARHEDGTPMAAQELRDELMTLLVAGHETTASQLAWAFEALTRTPHARERLTAEIDAGHEDAYLTATLHETLRRRPVLPNAAPRLTKRPITVGDWTYPENVCLVAGTYLIHHDPEIYPEPYAFRPERFLDRSPGTYTWTPFGGGRRRCLGASFAMLEMKVVLRAILSSCDVRPAHEGAELTRRRSITLSPRAGARVVLRPRTTAQPAPPPDALVA